MNMFSNQVCVLRVFVVFVFLVGVGWCEEDYLFSNSWAVEVNGGPHIANQLAEKHGFINKGQV